jgi:hypothetical protein
VFDCTVSGLIFAEKEGEKNRKEERVVMCIRSRADIGFYDI